MILYIADARQAKSDLRSDSVSERDGATASAWASASGMPRARAQQPHGRRPSHPDVTDSPCGLVGSQKHDECVKNVWATKVLLQYHGCIPGLVIYRARASSPPLVPPPRRRCTSSLAPPDSPPPTDVHGSWRTHDIAPHGHAVLQSTGVYTLEILQTPP